MLYFFRNISKTIAALFLVGCCSLCLAATHYTALIDAGSSGSRMYVFQHQIDKKKIVNIELLGSQKIKPGLSTFADDPKNINNYLLPLIDFAKKTLGSKTPERAVKFYLLATAGMRLISPHQQKTIYAAVKNSIKTNSQFHISAIETIPGKYEGAYLWIAANYLNQSLTPQKTYAVMDMGGASTQITFATNNSAGSDNNLHFLVDSNYFNVSSTSYLGLGQNQARNQYANDPNCFPINYPLPNDKSGAGSYSLCAKDVAALVKNVRKISPQIPANMKTFALSGFYYLASSDPFHLTGDFSAQTLQTKGTKFCATNWANIEKQYGNNSHLYSYCFNAAYFNQLLTKGYGFDATNNFITTDSISGQSIAWPLGALIYSI